MSLNTKGEQIVSKLEIIKDMAEEKSVKQLADVMIDYIKSETRAELGFKNDES